MIRALKRLLKILFLINRNKGKHVKLSMRCNPSINISFGGFNKIGDYSAFEGEIGYGSYIGQKCSISGKIGKYCSIGHNVVTLTGTHPAHDFVSTSPCFYSLEKQNGLCYVDHQKYKEKQYAEIERHLGIIVGNDVWVGYGATIFGGVTIGDGAIIGAQAIINKDVPPYAIVAGIPGRIIGYRFDADIINYLLELKWWDKSEAWIRSHADLFENVRLLMNHDGDYVNETIIK